MWGGGGGPTDLGLVLRICANHELYLVNAAAAADSEVRQDKDNTVTDKDNTVTITHGSILVGYNKGKWQTNCSGDAKEIRYTLTNSSDAVIYNGHQTTVGTLVSQKRLTPEADVARCC